MSISTSVSIVLVDATASATRERVCASISVIVSSEYCFLTSFHSEIFPVGLFQFTLTAPCSFPHRDVNFADHGVARQVCQPGVTRNGLYFLLLQLMVASRAYNLSFGILQLGSLLCGAERVCSCVDVVRQSQSCGDGVLNAALRWFSIRNLR